RAYLRYEFRTGPENYLFLSRLRYRVEKAEGQENEKSEILSRLSPELGRELFCDETDWNIDRFLWAHRTERLGRGHWLKLWPWLSGRKELYCEGRPVSMGEGRRGLELEVLDHAGVLVLRLVPEAENP